MSRRPRPGGDHSLILVEGLPGTGKTTVSKRIFTLLTEQGIPSALLLEDDASMPCNFRDIAGVPKSEFTEFSMSFVAETDHYFYIHLGKCDESTASQLRRYDLGDEYNPLISLREYTRCTLEWWRNWAANSAKEPVLVLDGAFMQCPINEMIYRGASDSETMAYILNIAEILKPFYPICVYLRRGSAETAIHFAKAVKGEQWAKGVEGSLAALHCPNLFERRFHLENTLLQVIPGVICDIVGDDWSDAEPIIQGICKRRAQSPGGR